MLFGIMQIVFYTVMIPSTLALIIAVMFSIEFHQAAMVVGMIMASFAAYASLIVGERILKILATFYLADNKGDQDNDSNSND